MRRLCETLTGISAKGVVLNEIFTIILMFLICINSYISFE